MSKYKHLLNDTPTDRVFEPDNPNWFSHLESNIVFLRSCRAYLNSVLRSREPVFLNEAYANMGFSRTRNGAILGWKKDDIIDFKIIPGKDGSIFIQFGELKPILDELP